MQTSTVCVGKISIAEVYDSISSAVNKARYLKHKLQSTQLYYHMISKSSWGHTKPHPYFTEKNHNFILCFISFN